jgi:hypothetical protein
MNSALKIEDLDLSNESAAEIESVLKDFLSELGYSDDRIDALECRSRSGFSPYSHNKGGFEAVAFTSMFSLPNGSTGFDNADATIEKARDYMIKLHEEEVGAKYADWTEDQREAYYDTEMNDEDTVLFSVDLMLNDENSLNVRMCVCAKDSPYHRKYDDKLEFDIEFKTPKQLATKLKALLKLKSVGKFSDNLRDAF